MIFEYRTVKKFFSLIIFCLVLSAFIPLQAQGKEARIAFLEFRVNSQKFEKDLGVSASERLQNVVLQNSQVFVVERTQFQALAKEHELQYSALVDENTAIEIGKIAGADYVVLGSVNAMGDVVFISARLVDVQQGLVLNSFEVTSKNGLGGLYYALRDMGERIAQALSKRGIAKLNEKAVPPTPTPKPTPRIPQPVPTRTPVIKPPTATPIPINPEESFSSGLEAFEKKNFSQAVKDWRRASEVGHVEATARLGECYYHGWGVSKNTGKAFSLLKNAAARNSSYARAILYGIDPNKFAQYRSEYLSSNQESSSGKKTQAITPTLKPVQQAPLLLQNPEKTAANSKTSIIDQHMSEPILGSNMSDRGKDPLAFGLELYFQGQYTEALKYFKTSSEKGIPLGIYMCSYVYELLYEVGQGTEKELRISQKYERSYRETVEKSMDGYKENLKIIQFYAKKGNLHAQFLLGRMYYYGHGVSKNYKEAVAWYRKAAEQGNTFAQSNLGWMYVKGQGVPENDKEAMQWFRKSAERGNSHGQYGLGWMYFYGHGVSKNYEEAVAWYRKAARQGNTFAQSSLGWMYHYGQGVPKNEEEAMQWFRKSAEQGNSHGQYGLGWMCRHASFPDLGRVDCREEAIKWLLEAAEQGYAPAQYEFAEICYEEKNFKKAVQWFRESAEQGHAHAQERIGWFYMSGYDRVLSVDMITAYMWFLIAEENGFKTEWWRQQMEGKTLVCVKKISRTGRAQAKGRAQDFLAKQQQEQQQKPIEFQR